MTVNMSILYENSDLAQSKVCYSNTRQQFCMHWSLLSLEPNLHLRKNSKHCKKLVVFSQYTPNQFFLIHQILNSNKKSITVMQYISSI